MRAIFRTIGELIVFAISIAYIVGVVYVIGAAVSDHMFYMKHGHHSHEDHNGNPLNHNGEVIYYEDGTRIPGSTCCN